MKVLGIDTATMMGSIGLIDDEGAIAEYSLNIRATHSERLMPAIDRLLKDSGIMPKDIDGFAVSIGPGIIYRPSHRPCNSKGVCNGLQ